MKALFTSLLPLIFILGLGSSKIAIRQNPEKREFEYKVVINQEKQYSLWLSDKKSPEGWQNTGISGNQNRCQAYIEEVWTDMRPLSIQRMELSENTGYRVVINHEEQYSVWPTELDLPTGWKAIRAKGAQAKCTDYIREVWTDMRPLSLRKSVAQRKN